MGKFLQMESLTLCPIDTAPIDVLLLTEEEKNWLNVYHQLVFEKLSPWLDEEDKNWLQEATKSLK